jgi:hypothetical protein
MRRPPNQPWLLAMAAVGLLAMVGLITALVIVVLIAAGLL